MLKKTVPGNITGSTDVISEAFTQENLLQTILIWRQLSTIHFPAHIQHVAGLTSRTLIHWLQRIPLHLYPQATTY